MFVARFGAAAAIGGITGIYVLIGAIYSVFMFAALAMTELRPTKGADGEVVFTRIPENKEDGIQTETKDDKSA